MTKIITSVGKGAAVSGAEDDANQSSLAGINTSETGTTHTVDVNDQNDTVEYSNASAIAVTLPAISTLTGSNIDTDDFKYTALNVGAGTVTITANGLETFNNGSATLTLLTNEYATIQTDSTLGVWNVISSGGPNMLGVTSTAAELNILDGVTATATEINILAGKTSFEDGADVTDTANVTAAGALMDSEVDADIKTLVLPASTTISAFGASLVDDASSAAAVATLGLDADIQTLSLPASTTISAFGATLIDDASAAAAMTTLGLLDEDTLVSDSSTLAASQQSIKAYVDSKFVPLDTPVALVTASSTTGAWTQIDMSVVYPAAATAGAITAVVKVDCNSLVIAGTSVTSAAYLRKRGSTLANNTLTRVSDSINSESSSGSVSTRSSGETIVNLDANSDLDWYHEASGSTNSFSATLVGYYI